MRVRFLGLVFRLALFLALGAIAFIFQADRWASKHPNILVLVPEGLGGFADTNRVVGLESASPGSGLELAKVVVAQRPVPAVPLRLLSNAAIEHDDVDLAGDALTLAGQRGWRDTFTQIAVMSSAIAAGEWVAAAERADAMARTGRDRRLIERGLSFLISRPEGRSAIAVRLTEGAPLSAALIGLVRNDESQLQAVVDIFVLADAAGTQMTCTSFANLTNFLLTKGHDEEAIEVWPSRCRTPNVDGLNFNLDLESEDPLAWQYRSGSGLSLRAGDAQGTLDVRNRSVIRQVFALRHLTLEPGKHVLSVTRKGSRVSGLGPDRQSELIAVLRCNRGQDGSTVTLIDEEIASQVAFSVPIGCATQRLSLSTSRGTAESVGVEID